MLTALIIVAIVYKKKFYYFISCIIINNDQNIQEYNIIYQIRLMNCLKIKHFIYI